MIAGDIVPQMAVAGGDGSHSIVATDDGSQSGVTGKWTFFWYLVTFPRSGKILECVLPSIPRRLHVMLRSHPVARP